MALEPETARGLLLGLIGLQRGVIKQDQLLAAIDRWLEDPSQDVGAMLSAQGLLDDAGRETLEGLVRDCLGEHDTGHDPEHTVAYAGRPPGEVSRTVLPSLSVAARPSDAGHARFKILRAHARGGLGEVLLAVDPLLKRQVALKRMQAELIDDPVNEARFLLEAEVTAGLEHPGIVPVHDLARDADGRPFYVMRFIEGETLRAAIARYHGPAGRKLAPRDRELAARRLLQSLVAACNAVAYAHSRGVVHRDLKPDNIMLGPFGETLVVDWGIAKPSSDPPSVRENQGATREDEDSSLTRPGSAIGTPRYMSPEQAAGKLEDVGPASDIYGLGATLYSLLTGQAPFPDGRLGEILDRVRRGIFPAPRSILRSVDPALEAICLKAMALCPEDRHASALALGEEIESWLADVRYRGEQAMALDQVRATLARLAIERAHNQFLRQRHDEGMLWLARALESVPPSEPWLERAVRSSLGSWHARGRLLERSITHEAPVLTLAFSPDGHRLASGTGGGMARFWDVATAHPLSPPLPGVGPTTSLAFSPDGRSLATSTRDGGLRLWDAVTGNARAGSFRHSAAVTAFCFSPDGEVLASASRAIDPCLWRVATGEPLHPPGAEDVVVRALAFDPHGRVLASAREDGRVICWDVGSGVRARGDLEHAAAVTSLAFGPDGAELLSGGADGKARIWNLAGEVQPRELAMPAGICQVDWCRSRNIIVTSCEDGAARLWNPVRGQPVGEPLVHDGPIECLAFSHDGAWLATGSQDGTVRLWETGTALPIGPPLVHRGAVHALAFSPDGRRLATGCGDGLARLWRVGLQLPGEVERVACWVRVTTGLDFDEADAICKLDPTQGWELQRRLHELGGPPPRKIEKW